MIETRLRWFVGMTAGVLVLLTLMPRAAAADLVTFRGGRTMSVSGVAFDGDRAVVTLRSGGEMWVPRDFVLAVVPDEVPYVPPAVESTVVVEAVAAVELAAAGSREDLIALVDRLAARHGVNAQLAQALVKVESNYESRAVSRKGAMGLMQLMPATARQYALDDPFDPAQNLDAGLRHLRGLLDRYGKGKESLALAAYNAGEGAVTRYKGIPPYRETQDYVRRILTLTGR